ncbi:FecR family protein [Neorhizobium sp. NCHU2750]|uniref:FecR family protein n=1 Tax=Neorhizobium sp. NCHU2750 TaxID=1825976 RepID=UPI000EB62EA7|nr:transmembrane sensor [Neorhizobium sp. NCHU2750]
MSDDIEALKKEAMAWIVRLTSGEATTDDRDALMRWRARSPIHEEAFREATRLWKNMGPALSHYAEPQAGFMSRRTFFAGSAGVAAGAAAACLGLSELGILPTIDALTSDYSTAVGQQKTVQLTDGSTVTLDAGTVLNANFSGQMRKAELIAGAAVFNIAEEPRPFVISAAAGISTVRQASVSIKHGAEDVLIDCIDGAVDVECRGTAALQKGEGISYSVSGLGEKRDLDPETAASWRRGLLVFQNRPLADVVADINRHRRGKVMIARSSLSASRVSGVFHLDRPEEILAHLENTLQVRPINLVGGIVLLQ